jgi:hypothetical protein
MSDLTEQQKYIQNLESLLTIAMHRLGNDIEISDEEFKTIDADVFLDVTNTDGGLRIRMTKDV